MNVQFDKLDNVYGMLTIKLEETDYQDKVKKQLREIGMKRPEPGFRPGHVPAGLLQKKYGTAVKYDVVNREVSDALFNYIKDNNVRTMGDPVPQKNDSFNIEDKDFEFKFKVGLFPEVNVKVDKNLTIPYYKIEVSDDMVKRQDEMLCKRFGSQVPGEAVEPEALVKGEIVELDENGQPKAEGIVVENGIVSPDYFKSEDQKKLFEGKKLGDVVRFNPAATCDGNETELSSMLNIDKAETANHHGDFNLTIKEIIVLRPAEHNQEFYDKAFGKDNVKSEEEYTAKLKEMIAAQLTNDSNYRFSIDAKDALMKEAGEFYLPDEALKEAIRINNEKLSAEDIDKRYESYIPELKWLVVRDTVAEQLGVKVEEADIRNVAAMFARQQFAQYGLANVPDDALTHYVDQMLKDKKTREQIINDAMEMKFFGKVKETANVEEKTVTVEEFNALFAPKAEEKAE